VSEYLLVFPSLFQSQYIINLADYREESTLEGINDTRNGLLLNTIFHRPFGESRIAFLRVGYYLYSNRLHGFEFIPRLLITRWMSPMWGPMLST
jgi:hypothetical protein